jgi:hypothetical protein
VGLVENVTVEGLAGGDVCAIATDRYHRIALWRQLFTALIFALAVVIAVLAVLAVIFATDEEWAGTVATALGALATGKPLSWVVSRRSDAVTEEATAFTDYKDACGADGQPPAFVESLKF